jgi:hypothetical protein
MNSPLYLKLIGQYQNSATYAHYVNNIDWVKLHLERLCTEYAFLETGALVKHTIGGTTRVSKIRGFIVSTHSNALVGIDTGYGNIWYHEAEKPTDEEVRAFELDGHCLVLSEA